MKSTVSVVASTVGSGLFLNLATAIEIATILARDLKLSIFDEPEAGIDLWSFAKLVETFQHLQAQSKQSIILISHQERIMQLADEIIIIENGRMKTRGTREAILPSLRLPRSSL